MNYYLSEEKNIEFALEMTGLSLDELEMLVGRFTKRSHRAGLLKGELVQKRDGSWAIRHHFTKKMIWNDTETQNYLQEEEIR